MHTSISLIIILIVLHKQVQAAWNNGSRDGIHNLYDRMHVRMQTGVNVQTS